MKKRLVIAGLGFGGLYTFLHLHRYAHRHPEELEIFLINRSNYFLFTPLLHEVATGGVDESHIIQPIRRILRCCVGDFSVAEIKGLDLDRQILHTNTGAVEYDYLVLGLGATTNFFNTPGAAEQAFTLKNIDDAQQLKNQLLHQFERAAVEPDPAERRRRLRFVVVGGGPTGTELILEMAQFTEQLRKLYPTIGKHDMELVLIHQAKEVLPMFHPSIRRRALQILHHRGVKTRLGTNVVRVASEGAYLDGNELLPSSTVVWATGVKPASLNITPDFPDAICGCRLPVESTLQLKNRPNVFVLGDQAAMESGPLPATAQVAVSQAKTVARNVVALLRGRPLQSFQYHHRGDLVSLGRGQAAADLFGLHFSGFFAWWLWRTVYLLKLVGWSNRLRVVVDWTLDLFHQRDISEV